MKLLLIGLQQSQWIINFTRISL